MSPVDLLEAMLSNGSILVKSPEAWASVQRLEAAGLCRRVGATEEGAMWFRITQRGVLALNKADEPERTTKAQVTRNAFDAMGDYASRLNEGAAEPSPLFGRRRRSGR